MITRVLFILILVSFVAGESSARDGKWRKGKLMRYYRMEVQRQKDIQKLEDALKTVVEHSSENMRIFARMQLGALYEQMGNYSDAEKTLLEALEETRSLRPGPFASYVYNLSGTVYDSYERLAYFYLKTGNLRKAEALLKESDSVRTQIFPRLSVHRIHPHVGMGSLHFRKGDLNGAYALFSEAFDKMARATSTHYDYDNLYRLFLNDLVEICFSLNKQNEAARYLEKLKIASTGAAKFNTKIARRVEIARVFELMARNELYKGNLFKAQKYLDRANEFKPEGIAASDVHLRILNTQSLLYWAKGNHEAASKSFLRMASAYRGHISKNFVFMSEYEKEQFYHVLKKDFDLLNSYAVAIYDQRPDSLFAGVFDNVINTKALLLNESMKRKQQILESDNAKLKQLFREWEVLKARLSATYYDKEKQGQIKTLESDIERIEKEINRETGLFATVQEQHSWGQIRSILQPGEAAVEIVRIAVPSKSGNILARNSTDSVAYAVMVLQHGKAGINYFLIENGRSLETKYISFYRNAVMGQIDDKYSYDKFWLPIRKNLRGVTRVYLSSDGVYNQINLNALRNPATNQYVLDEIDLRYVTNTADLLREKSSDVITRAVLVGRPSYTIDVAVQDLPDAGESEDYGLRNLLSEELADFREQSFADLPGTEKEIGMIRQTLERENINVTTLKGSEATEENVKRVASPGILHIATHGFFVEDSANVINPMIRSGVILAGVRNTERSSSEDGILTAYEATHLNLDETELVVLSACETGLGEVRNGEGVYGLQRAIIVAGSNNLLMSLWKVDDAATADLMSNLYSGLKGKTSVEAFRDAQMKLREKYPHPFYWGAFIMLGK